MAEVEPFLTDRPGVRQGRVTELEGILQAPEGDYALVMGSDLQNDKRRFNIGDAFEFAQSDTVAAEVKVTTFRGTLRGPAQMPAITNEEPAAGWVLANGQTVTMKIDEGSPQTYTVNSGDFANVGAARSSELVAAINAQISGATASLTGNGVQILSNTTGRRSRVEITGGTAAALDFKETYWVLQVKKAGTVKVEIEIPPGDTRNLRDIGVPFDGGGAVELSFRLELKGRP